MTLGCAVVVGHPFDLVKVRLQTAEKGVYSSAVDVVRKSVAAQIDPGRIRAGDGRGQISLVAEDFGY